MESHSPIPAPRLDLRERRRREMVRTIANAAVDLFERNGFQATTIDEIAAEAGISRTTFFRHCATKEATVLVDDGGLETELIAIAATASPERPLHDLETAWESMAALFDEDHVGHDRFLRVRRLMRDVPALHAAGLERDALLATQLTDALADGPGLSALDARAVAETFALGIRLAFDEWVRRVDQAPDVQPPLNVIYRQVREALLRAGETSTL
ncbi:AcrR family transcriptional regulator [Microbacterium resistens]|uniref:AcrR family transcriptional regulator n=1 Tax=Microbacterium resistens TaxID=156977 RepID=A0ABU1SCV7_9MICO|nr:helix-turn-helix domain-containing protein [Microbacterium resistens]MDR6867409.1 AcrR family transcriptional regulator [Microbacterium resistens]